jgi:hypothetical protein
MTLDSPGCATRLAMSAVLIAALAGCGGAQDQKRFVAEQRAAAVGYRFEHFERERLLFVHRPNGQKDGIELATLRRVYLHRQDARDSVDGKTKYWLTLQGPDATVFAPFFSTEPETLVGMLERELAGFDQAAADFRDGRGRYCQLWASAEYLKETPADKPGCRP